MATVAAGASAPAALAADDCPNAKVRAQQFRGAELPNCFAYERVTPNDKGGSEVLPDGSLLADGSVVSVWSQVQLFASDDPGGHNVGIATRTGDGWKIRFQTNSPLIGTLRPSDLNDVAWPYGESDDLQSLLFRTQTPLDPGDLGNSNYGEFLASPDLYISRPDGSMEWVSAPASGAVPSGTDVAGATEPTVISADSALDMVVFGTNRVMDPALSAAVANHVWVWRSGHGLAPVDRLPDGSFSTTTGPIVNGLASADAQTAIFTSANLHGRSHAYARLGIGTADERTVLVSANAAGAPCGDNVAPMSLTADGRYARFVCGASLTPDAPPTGGPYVRDLRLGTVVYDPSAADFGPLASIRGEASTEVAWSRPEGTYKIRRRMSTDPTPAGPAWGAQLMRVDLATNHVTCVSCPTDGSTPTDPSPQIAGRGNAPSGARGQTMKGMVTPDGEVVFSTLGRLVAEDTNDQRDVYMWKDGKHHLLSSGVAPTHTELGGVSVDGTTITFASSTALVPEDRDGGELDIYVLRKDGGFYRAPVAPECSSDCQGAGSAASPVVTPLSMAFPASGDAADTGADPIAVSGSRSVTGTSLKVKVRVPAGGRASVSGSGLRSASKTVSKASTVTLSVKLSDASKRALRGKRSIKRTATVRYAPASGDVQSKRVSLTFKRKATKKKASSRGVAPASNGKAAR